MKETFNLQDEIKQTEELGELLKEALIKCEKPDILEQMHEQLERIQGEEIKMVFVGQYSAGKSTLIKALTGNKSIAIDSDIATDTVRNYPWGNQVLLVDTPGLNTNENEMHDELTIKAIGEADLIVYCITSDLFHEVTRNDFLNLASKYRSKLFLVINKMNKESGDYEELVYNYTESINKTFAPEYSLTEFHHFFVDAADYLTGLDKNDHDYIDDSHFEGFIEELNRFIAVKRLTAKLITPVDIIESIAEEALTELENDEHIRENRLLTEKIIKAVRANKKLFVKACADEIQKASNKYIQKGTEISLELGEKNISFHDDDLQNFSEPIQESLCNNITSYFEQYAQTAENEVQEILTSEMAMHFFNEDKKCLEHDIEYKNNSAEDYINKANEAIGKVTVNAVPKVNSMLAKWANATEGQKITIWTVKGSDLHNVVLKIGKKLGHKFKPFEALKVSKRIAELSKWVGPVLTGAGTLLELVGMIVEYGADKKVQKVKEGIKATFQGMADENETYYNEQVNEAAKEFDEIEDMLNAELDRLANERKNNKEVNQILMDLKKKAFDLKRKIEYPE